MTNYKLDAFDERIIKELTDDARIPMIQLANKLKVSNTFVHQRIKKLKEYGIMKKATYRLDPLSLGYESSGYTQIMITHPKHHRKVEEELAKIPEIVECVNISGRYALLVRIYAKNNRSLRDVIYGKIQPIEGVEGTNTTISFETAFRRNVPLLVEDDA